MSGADRVLEVWDSMADSIANRRDECIERGQNFQADLYRDMLAAHRESRAAVAELIAAAAEKLRELSPDGIGHYRLRDALAACGVKP